MKITEPRVANRDCDHCQKYCYDERTGKVMLAGRDHGPPLPRPKGNLPPCRLSGVGCPKGTPENPLTLNAANEECYQHYRECRAIGQFPDEPIVRRHAAIIRGIEDGVARAQALNAQSSLLSTMTAMQGLS